jgi:hypothetical protein
MNLKGFHKKPILKKNGLSCLYTDALRLTVLDALCFFGRRDTEPGHGHDNIGKGPQNN